MAPGAPSDRSHTAVAATFPIGKEISGDFDDLQWSLEDYFRLRSVFDSQSLNLLALGLYRFHHRWTVPGWERLRVFCGASVGDGAPSVGADDEI